MISMKYLLTCVKSETKFKWTFWKYLIFANCLYSVTKVCMCKNKDIQSLGGIQI